MIVQGGSLVRVAVIFPGLLDASGFPGYPFLSETGNDLIQHVYEQACAGRCAGDVIVATDDERIRVAVESFGGRVAMTRADHPSGTDRVAEVAASLAADVVINFQGDEPMLDPASLDLLADLLARDPGSDMATLAVPIADRETYLSPNVVKVVCDDRGRALYFSRSPIPMVRDGEPDFTRTGGFLQHLGVNANRSAFLLPNARTPPHPLELTEKLEQRRVLGAGGTIQVGRVAHGHRGVDTPEDYEAFVRGWQGRKSRAA
jgi:3-deoxy-manno-octulosonate cytidylyltransferase (CMP-KDO synthetase)